MNKTASTFKHFREYFYNAQAAVVQLCVPIIAAILGVVFLSEQLTMQFVVASAVILGAVLLFILSKEAPKKFT